MVHTDLYTMVHMDLYTMVPMDTHLDKLVINELVQ